VSVDSTQDYEVADQVESIPEISDMRGLAGVTRSRQPTIVGSK